jgi:hypothetical protein
VVDPAVGERGEQLLERLRRVLCAAARVDPVARVAGSVGEVEIADVGEADDGDPRRGAGMLAARQRAVKINPLPARAGCVSPAAPQITPMTKKRAWSPSDGPDASPLQVPRVASRLHGDGTTERARDDGGLWSGSEGPMRSDPGGPGGEPSGHAMPPPGKSALNED